MTDQELQDFDLGNLTGERYQRVSDHLDSCPDCATRFENLDQQPDTLLDQLRLDIPEEILVDDSELVQLANAVAALGSSGENSNGEPPSASENPELPQQLGRFTVDRLLGKGGFGFVYLAHDQQRRPVAIKVLHQRLAGQNGIKDQFAQEAETLRRLQHPAIIRFEETFQADSGELCMVTEYVSGGTLAQQIGNVTWTPTEVAAFIAKLAEALNQMHLQEYTHRDVKPANILLDDRGKPRLADVGLALSDQAYGKGDQHIAGSLAYLSPEQARGDSHLVDGRTDIYSLGVVMFEMLTGRRPFHADQASELLRRIQNIAIKPPRQINAEIPQRLEEICLRATHKDASQRYATAEDFAADLRKFLTPETHRPWLTLAAGAAAVCAVVWLGWSGLISGSDPVEPARVTTNNATLVESTGTDRVAGAPVEVLDFKVLGSRGDGGFQAVEELRQLQPGDNVRFSIHLSNPAYVKLLWVDAQGTVQELYPMDPEQGDRGAQKVSQIESPEQVDRGWPLEPVGDSELALLLVSREPIPDGSVTDFQWGTVSHAGDANVTRYVASRTAKPIVDGEDSDSRGLGGGSRQVNDPVLQLMEQLRQQLDRVHAVRIPTSTGKSE